MQEIDLIFQQYYRPLCLYATHYLHDIDEAEDVVQDCFVKLISRNIMPETSRLSYIPLCAMPASTGCAASLR